MKNVITLLFILFTLSSSGQNAACTVTIDSVVLNGTRYMNPDTINVCQGDVFYVYSTSYCLDSLMADNFNSGTLNPGWTSNTTPMFTNPCGPSPDGSIYLWIGPATNFPRELITVPMNVTTQGQICFDMKYASQGNSTPCEGPDESTEGVHLQWSLDQVGPWNEINYWDPVGGYDPYLTTWNHYCENIPVNGTIYFRWFQTNTSGNDYDHWGLDNVSIEQPGSTPWSLEWSDGSTVISSAEDIVVAPTQNTTFTLNLTSGTLTLSDSFYVNIVNPTLSINGLDTFYLTTDPPVLISGNPQPGVFSGPGIFQPSIFSPLSAGPGIHDITWTHYAMGTSFSYGTYILFEDDFSTDMGWTGYGQGGWERDTAQASTLCTGGQDPADDHSPGNDDYIIGTYIGECYPNGLTQTYWLTSPVIDCSFQSNCILDFYSVSGCESVSFDKMYIDVYSGSAWVTIYTNTGSSSEALWTHRSYPIPQAANNNQFQVRFGLGTTDGSVVYQGWNIDDLKITCTGNVPIYDTLCTFSYSQQVVVELPSGTNIKTDETTFSVYPNPAENLIFITLNQKNEKTATIYESTGRQIKKVHFHGPDATISIGELAPGLYFIEVDNERKIFLKN